MAQPTQLDTQEEDPPVATEDHVSKKPRVESTGTESGNDWIKWVEGPDGPIPFVKRGQTGLVHCGRSVMSIRRSEWDQLVVVTCVAGCDPTCGSMFPDCKCLCHVLQEHYSSRVANMQPKWILDLHCWKWELKNVSTETVFSEWKEDLSLEPPPSYSLRMGQLWLRTAFAPHVNSMMGWCCNLDASASWGYHVVWCYGLSFNSKMQHTWKQVASGYAWWMLLVAVLLWFFFWSFLHAQGKAISKQAGHRELWEALGWWLTCFPLKMS